MDILGIGPGELLVIMIILLVVVGPERLPGLARQAGKFLVTARNWVQRSPDAAIVLRARQELEQELAVLRSSLAEVQNARDEVLEAAKQINQSVSDDVLDPARQSIGELRGQPGTVARGRTPNGPPTTPAASAAAADAVDQPAVNPAASDVVQAPADGAEAASPIESGGLPVEAPILETPAIEAPPEPAPTPQPSGDGAAELARLEAQLQQVTAEMRALQEQLRRRGLLDDEWQVSIAQENERAHVEQ